MPSSVPEPTSFPLPLVRPRPSDADRSDQLPTLPGPTGNRAFRCSVNVSPLSQAKILSPLKIPYGPRPPPNWTWPSVTVPDSQPTMVDVNVFTAPSSNEVSASMCTGAPAAATAWWGAATAHTTAETPRTTTLVSSLDAAMVISFPSPLSTPTGRSGP